MTVLSAAVILKDGNDTESARAAFAKLGFGAQTISEGVLLLMAEAGVFEKAFKTELMIDDAGPRAVTGTEESRQLPPAVLPGGLRDSVKEIEFEAPLDFGPKNF